MKKRFLANLIPFGSGVAATLVTLGLFVDVNAQSSNEVVDTCAKADGTLRLIRPFGTCAEGERLVRLREPELDKQEEKPREEPKQLDLDRRVKDLEDRASRGRLLGSRVFAPFEVINEAGYRVFMVEDGMVRFYNAVGKLVARVVMNETGGYFEARSATADLQAVIGAVEQQSNVFVIENGNRRINLGRNDKGQYGLRVYEPGGKLVAGIGQSTGGGDGVVTVADQQGIQRAAMYVNTNGGGVLDIINKQGKTVASVLATEHGNGRLQLFNQAGVTMVEAGVNENNIGVVRAGPAGFHPGVGILGLPGSFIVGKAAQ